jgi:predicted amidophosphoribosyltransferase
MMSYSNKAEREKLIDKLKSVFKNDEFSIEKFGDNREIALIYDYSLTGATLKQCRKFVKRHEEIYELSLISGVPMVDSDIRELMINGLN